MIRDYILQPVRGTNGFYVAVREAVNNSLDAEATKVLLKYGEYNGEPALFILDNGSGMTHEGITSAMSYGHSSRKREDTKTIGTNGTGMKSLLGLNYSKLEKTLITAFTVSEPGECTKMEITFNYILKLAEKKAKGDDYIETVDLPSDWERDMKRTTGSTVIITGFDGRKIKTTQQIVDQFGEFLTPKACEFVEILHEGKWHKIPPATLKGEHYNIELESPSLGKVIFDLYYGTRGEGPKVCGPINSILSITALWDNMSKSQRSQFPTYVWKNISGYIYIPTANVYRQHEGGFSESFYTSNTCLEFIDMLKQVGEELEKLSGNIRGYELKKRRDVLLEKIVRISNSIDPVKAEYAPTDAGNKESRPSIKKDQDVYILPKGLRMYPAETIAVMLNNVGKGKVDFSRAQWKSNSNIISVTDIVAGTARLTAYKEGSAKVTITGTFGEHVINVFVSPAPSHPYISGPNYIKPGNGYSYELKRHQRDNVYWGIRKEDLVHGISITETKNKKEITLNVPFTCPDRHVCMILVKNQTTDALIAQKNVTIADNGSIGPVMMMHIGKKDYVIQEDTHLSDAIAQVDYAFNDFDLPVIVVNNLHPRIRDQKPYYAADPILISIATAAMLDQVAEELITPEAAPKVIEDFAAVIKKQIFDFLKKDIDSQKPEKDEE